MSFQRKTMAEPTVASTAFGEDRPIPHPTVGYDRRRACPPHSLQHFAIEDLPTRRPRWQILDREVLQRMRRTGAPSVISYSWMGNRPILAKCSRRYSWLSHCFALERHGVMTTQKSLFD